MNVEYTGNDTYLPSTALDTATGEELKNITDTAIYTLNISLTKLSDDWVIDQLNN